VKPFATYQWLAGEEMTDRDKIETESRFWNKGKWDNFVLPLILEGDYKEQTFVDMGCNAGLFLKFASELGFGQVIGVDSDETAVKRGEEWRDKNGGNYKFRCLPMEKCLNDLPLADVTVLANAHYYFTINDWLDYLDQLAYKTRYVIIVTAEKRSKQRCWASADVPDIRNYFRGWEEIGFIDELPFDDDLSPRRLWGLCFKSPYIERVPIDSLDCGNHVQDQFYAELDLGKDYKETRYYRILKKYRQRWGEERLNKWFEERIRVYNSVKENQLIKPILIDSALRVLDGNHRYAMMRNLGFKSILVRRT
jgi:hypothetical protein